MYPPQSWGKGQRRVTGRSNSPSARVPAATHRQRAMVPPAGHCGRRGRTCALVRRAAPAVLMRTQWSQGRCGQRSASQWPPRRRMCARHILNRARMRSISTPTSTTSCASRRVRCTMLRQRTHTLLACISRMHGSAGTWRAAQLADCVVGVA